MEDKTLKIKERILISIVIILIILIPFSIMFEKKPSSVKVTNFDILKMNDSSQKLTLSLQNTEEQALECKINLKFYKNNIIIKEESKEIGAIKSGENRNLNFIVDFPEGKTVLKMKPICGPTINFP